MRNRYKLSQEHWDNLNEQDRCLVAACHWYTNSVERWARCRETGLEDKELMDVIKSEFGTDASRGGPDIPCISVKARIPAFWYGQKWTEMPEEPILKGAKLRNEIRRVMQISYPVEQLALF